MEKRYWFKRKIYGWGWYPATWEGWLVLGVYTGALVSLVTQAGQLIEPSRAQQLKYFGSTLLLTLILLAISYWKGEQPRWQWGRKQNDQ